MGQRDGRTDGQTPYRFIDPASQYYASQYYASSVNNKETPALAESNKFNCVKQRNLEDLERRLVDHLTKRATEFFRSPSTGSKNAR